MSAEPVGKVVLDTSVLVSGTLFAGTPSRVIELARSGTLHGVTSLFILREFQDVLVRPKIGVTPEVAELLAVEIADFTEVVAVEMATSSFCGDPGDNAIIETAIRGGATHIVTGDKLLLASCVSGVAVVTPAELVRLVGVTRP
jgi:putative PIN family toxin of toxin-antitoxin system